MRMQYREKVYECGDYLEVDIYPVFREQGGKCRRRAKSKPTRAVQEKLNQRNAERKLIRILNGNFTKGDIHITLTYRADALPETYEESLRDARNYLRRVNRMRKKLGLPELKYVLIPGEGKFHFHIIMNGGLSRDVLEELWGYGYANTERLQFTENGLAGLATYIGAQFITEEGDKRERGQKRYSCSRNIVMPEGKERDGRISQRLVCELATVDSESRAAFEKLYRGYTFVESKPFYNDFNGGYYITVRMHKSAMRLDNSKERRSRYGTEENMP